MSTLTLDQMRTLASGIASLPTGHNVAGRIADETLRTLTKASIAGARAEVTASKLATAQLVADAALRARDYSPANAARIVRIHALYARVKHVYAARAEAISAARTWDAEMRRCAKGMLKGDTSLTLDYATAREHVFAATERWGRLGSVIAVLDRAISAAGAFAISANDASASGTSRFYRSAVWHWHDYTGGRHAALAPVFMPEDIFGEAIALAYAEGQIVDGLPAYGVMHRNVRRAAERVAADTRRSYFATRDALNGHRPVEAPDYGTDDKHVMRRLGLAVPGDVHERRYGTRDDHAAAMGDAERERDAAAIKIELERQGRVNALPDVSDGFARAIGTLVLDGATIEDIAAAMSSTVEKVMERCGVFADVAE